ncbi:HAD family hydrolase [Solirubrobacter deserti]|uniref:HAD family phosphatase n=1 Tax=Solirubrobacter deserti TaxID=2282478 RepID=A0ABT4RNR3_9ACTN|nr:HAD family phosphatase [Solirubrobacter deserti]MDA0140198.1 HAD family phosphatase [Solirubrobacter deserti]
MIFDCDGTLVDSEPLSGEAWRRTLAPYGYAVTDEDLEACVGITYTRTHAYLAERVEIPSADALWPELRTTLFALIDERLEPFDDALETLAALRASGVPVAVASSSVRERLDHTLASAGLQFEITVAGDEVAHGKPAPDMFLLAAKRLGIVPGRCVVVEDSAPGVAAGRAAGMPTLGVCRVPGAESLLAVADRVVNILSVDEVVALGAV